MTYIYIFVYICTYKNQSPGWRQPQENMNFIYETSILSAYETSIKNFCPLMIEEIKKVTPEAHIYKVVSEFGIRTVLIFDNNKKRIGHIEPKKEKGYQLSSIYFVKK